MNRSMHVLDLRTVFIQNDVAKVATLDLPGVMSDQVLRDDRDARMVRR